MTSRQGKISTLSVIAFLVLLIVDANLVGYSGANPYTLTGTVPPDQETYPPVITIFSPVNNTAYNASLVSLKFNVTAPQSRTAWRVSVQHITYKGDWQKEAIDVLCGGQQPSFNFQLSKVPEGQHNILIKAIGYGYYKYEEDHSYKDFFISSTATISFTVDCTAPAVLVLSPENVSETSTVPLNLVVNEACSRIAYSLNGEQNVTVSGNSTIPHLPAGQYNVTFYAWDTAGNIGASETENFKVAEIPQTAQAADGSLVLPAVGAPSAVVIVGVVLFFKKRPHASR